MGLPCDWQISKRNVSQRGRYLLETGQWSDCNFIVGQEPHQQILKGHKLFLAMSSPVFEAMFFGGMAEKNDPIPIPDVQPEAFKALLEYIYTDNVDLSSFELACELCYTAKKYMLPILLEECTKFLWSDLSSKKACRAYEFAKLFEEPVLMDKCLQIICNNTKDVLYDPSWEEVELGTLVTVLNQDNLTIDSEIELFAAVERWAKSECTRKALDLTDGKSLKSVIGNSLSKIRFLTMTPEEFANGPGKSPLLTQNEAFAILMNISSSESKFPMPEGFSINLQKRMCPFKKMNFPMLPSVTLEIPNSSTYSNLSLNNVAPLLNYKTLQESKLYCERTFMRGTQCLNTNRLDCSVTFCVNRNIIIYGIQVPTQILRPDNSARTSLIATPSMYTEVLYAHLLDKESSRMTYTHITTKVLIESLVEVIFNRSVYIEKNKMYKIGVVFDKEGWYPLGTCAKTITCDNVTFTFRVAENDDSIRDCLIRTILFTPQ
ncbi:BTB/POZ domain-containing protein 2 isoform X2 [Orussus abietinus]|uniref:BTB/POZ domain-containing protein 2 isoform X2 n=1 Tax=Orussus abietinus TaxID=222816 RepID=UPI0006268CBF|nr:BTB/POZ domain-containing protein 2 isoform X2 [Orussus abietinus]